jgi:hypothetical protein
LYFPEGGVPDDESLLLDTFKDGAFRLAIEHQILMFLLVLPIKRDSLILFQVPCMHVKIHKQIETFKNRFDTEDISGKKFGMSLYTQLVALRINERETDVYKKIVKKSWPWPTFLVLCLLILLSRFNFNFKFISNSDYL